MKSPLLTFHGYGVSSYGVFAVFGLSVLVARLAWKGREKGIYFFDAVFWGMGVLIACIVFATLAYMALDFEVFVYYFLEGEVGKAIQKAGMSFHGGLAGGLLATYWFSKTYNVPVIWMWDVLAPFCALAYSITRIGCYLQGCCWGKACFLSWAVVFPPTRFHRDLLPVHPIQLYDSFLNFCLFFVLLEVCQKQKFSGQTFLAFLIGNSIIRFFVEYFRWGVSAVVVGGVITQAQIASLVIILGSLIAWRVLSSKPVASGQLSAALGEPRPNAGRVAS